MKGFAYVAACAYWALIVILQVWRWPQKVSAASEPSDAEINAGILNNTGAPGAPTPYLDAGVLVLGEIFVALMIFACLALLMGLFTRRPAAETPS